MWGIAMEGHTKNKGKDVVSSAKMGGKSQRNKLPITDVVPLHGSAEVIAGSTEAKQINPDWVATFDAITDLVSIHNKDCKIVKVNKAFADTFKVKPEELTGKKCYEVMHGTKEPPAYCPHKIVIDTAKPHREEFFEPHLGLYLDVSASPTFNDNGTLTGYVHITKDITEREKMKQILQATEAELKYTIEVVPGIIAKANIFTGYFTDCNPELSNILGFSLEEFLARPFIEFIHPDDRQSTINKVEKQLEGIPLAKFENRYICKDGSYKWLEWKATAPDEKGTVYAVATDITERKKTEKKLFEYQERLRTLATQLSVIEERERKDIAKGLHDDVLGILSFLKIKVSRLQKTEACRNPKDDLAEMADTITDLNEKLRHFIFDLSNPILETSGLGPAVKDLLKKIASEHNIKTSINDDKSGKSLNSNQKTFLYKAVNELIVNIIKYARAKNISVSIETVDNDIIISVADDGIGFDTSDEEKLRFDRKHGFGLFNIKERLKSYGGNLTIESKIGKGTEVTIAMPLD